MTSCLRKAWVVVVVVLDFVVPSISRLDTSNVTCSQVFSVWAARVDKLDIVTVKGLGGVVSSVVSQGPVPSQALDVVQGSLFVVFV